MHKNRLQSPREAFFGLSFALLALSPVAAAATVHGQERANLHSESTSEEDTDGREAKRILHLRSGASLRVLSRRVGRRWEYQRGKTWEALPVEFVTRAVLERDARREAKRRARGIESRDLAGRAGHARWLVSEGLVREASDELAQVLEKDPDQPDVHALLDERSFRIAMPSLGSPESAEALPPNLDEFLRFCAGASPLGREFAVRALGHTDGRAALQERFEKELFVSSPRRRAFAAFACRRMFPGKLLRPLVPHPVLDPSASVRHESALALRDAREPAVIVPVVRALSSSHPRVRDQAASSLGTMGYASAVEPMMTALVAMTSAPQSGGGAPNPRGYIFTGKQTAYIQDFDVEVAQFQAVADPQVNILLEGSVLEARMQGVTNKAFSTTRGKLRQSLSQLTGADPGKSTRAWTRWWEDNGGAWASAARVDGDRR